MIVCFAFTSLLNQDAYLIISTCFITQSMTKTKSLTIMNLITPKAGSYRELLFNKLVLAPYLRLIYTRKVYHLKMHVTVTVVNLSLVA